MVARAALGDSSLRWAGITPQAPCTATCMTKAPSASSTGVEAKAHKGNAGSAISAATVIALTALVLGDGRPERGFLVRLRRLERRRFGHARADEEHYEGGQNAEQEHPAPADGIIAESAAVDEAVGDRSEDE